MTIKAQNMIVFTVEFTRTPFCEWGEIRWGLPNRLAGQLDVLSRPKESGRWHLAIDLLDIPPLKQALVARTGQFIDCTPMRAKLAEGKMPHLEERGRKKEGYGIVFGDGNSAENGAKAGIHENLRAGKWMKNRVGGVFCFEHATLFPRLG
jgi:hypothetical protein